MATRWNQTATGRQAFVPVEVPINHQDLGRPTAITIKLPGGAVVHLFVFFNRFDNG